MCAIWFNILWTFVNILWTFVNICEHFGGTYGITHKAFSVFCAYFVNILCTFVNICEHLWTYFVNICEHLWTFVHKLDRSYGLVHMCAIWYSINPRTPNLKPEKLHQPTEPKKRNPKTKTKKNEAEHRPKTAQSELRFLSERARASKPTPPKPPKANFDFYLIFIGFRV